MPRLGVNIDHVASVRQLRKGAEPRPEEAARIAVDAGADSVVVHLREDRRHICDKDLMALKKAATARLNLEMSVAPEIVKIACVLKPDRATLVPERRQELTTEGGLDVVAHCKRIKKASDALRAQGIGVSLFIDPRKNQIDAALKTGVDMVELHTGRFASALGSAKKNKFFKELKEAVRYAKGKGLHVFAGHGLDYRNVVAVARIEGVEELNIGYSIVCRAVLVGLGQAVKEMKRLVN